MINANELRIGNWVRWVYGFTNIGGSIGLHDEPYQITMNTFYTEVANEEGRTILKELYPIPVTSDILLKCGFEWNGGDHWTDKENLFWIENRGSDYRFCKPIITPYNLRTLHQLQNLYFSLTNNELNIEGL